MGSVQCQRTEVIVIGNGPSGISLSYILSGNIPYYNHRTAHDVPYLHNKLTNAATEPIVDQDLEYLSEGLEGRSRNPISILFDSLNHPKADLGIDADSHLCWTYQPARRIPHLVVGSGPPGGAWQKISGDMKTLSLASWMQLPDLPFREWITNNARFRGDDGAVPQDRASISDLASYYADYVTLKQLTGNFRSHHRVTSVTRVYPDSGIVSDSENGEIELLSPRQQGTRLWEVKGEVTNVWGHTAKFCFQAPNVVMATGIFDVPNKMDVFGESLPYIYHSIDHLEEVIMENLASGVTDPVMVVGGGLTGADAVLTLRQFGVACMHVFRRQSDDPSLVFNELSEVIYPDYKLVHRLMCSTASESETNFRYSTYPGHSVTCFKPDHRVFLSDGNHVNIVKASHVFILIGSNADLSFLPREGRGLGLRHDRPIDSNVNPIDVDPWSYECVGEPGLFAMGPLVGDRFVRYLQGGALGISAHLWKLRKRKRRKENILEH